jgi:hypothetical protein
MGFCTNCGAALQGQFCTKCGQSASEPVTPAASMPAPVAVAGGKRTIWPYFLFGCLGLIVLSVLAMVGTGLFVAKKVKDAGLDPGLMERNPAAAVAKILATVNPDIEILNFDEARGIIRVREKSTGKVMTLNFEDAKRGKIVFQEEGKGEVRIEGEGGKVQIKTPEGTAEIGTGTLKLPAWLPAYPSIASVDMNVTSSDGGMAVFRSKDDTAAVADFYESALNKAGMKVNKTTTQEAGQKAAFVLIGTKGESTASVSVAPDGEGGSQVSVSYK